MGKLKFLYVREILSEFAGTFILMVSRWYNQLCLPLPLVALVIQSAYFNKGRSLFYLAQQSRRSVCGDWFATLIRLKMLRCFLNVFLPGNVTVLSSFCVDRIRTHASQSCGPIAFEFSTSFKVIAKMCFLPSCLLGENGQGVSSCTLHLILFSLIRGPCRIKTQPDQFTKQWQNFTRSMASTLRQQNTGSGISFASE